MMRYQHLGRARRRTAEMVVNPRDLADIDASVLPNQGASRVHSQHSYFGICVERLQFIGDIAPEIAQRPGKAVEEIVQRDVVIAGHDDLRLGQPGEKIACLLELFGPRTLGEVARDDHDIGLDELHRLQQRIKPGVVELPEMNVGKMKQCAHRRSAYGTKTFNAPFNSR